MKKVFINNIPVILTPEIEPGQLRTNHFYVQSGSKDTLICIFHLLQKNKNTDTVYIHHADEKRLWKNFCGLFEIVHSAGGVVFNRKKELLMIYRNRKWDLPKGHLEKNETYEKAALREVREECGIKKLKIIKPVTTTYHTYLKKEQRLLKKTCWYRMEFSGSGTLKPLKDEGITRAKWFSQKKLNTPLRNTYNSIREVVCACSI